MVAECGAGRASAWSGYGSTTVGQFPTGGRVQGAIGTMVQASGAPPLRVLFNSTCPGLAKLVHKG